MSEPPPVPGSRPLSPSGWPQPPPARGPAGGPPGWGPTGTLGWPPPLPPPKRKLTWLWILLGVIGVAIIGVIVTVIVLVSRVKAPIDATNRLLHDVKAGDYAAAYQHSCQRNRDDYSPSEYQETMELAFNARGGIANYDVDYASLHGGGRARVRYTIEFRDTGEQRFGADVFREDGHWRPCLLESR